MHENLIPFTYSTHEITAVYPKWQYYDGFAFTIIYNCVFHVKLMRAENTKSGKAGYYVYRKVGDEWENIFQVDMQISNENIVNLEHFWNEFNEKFPEMVMEHIL